MKVEMYNNSSKFLDKFLDYLLVEEAVNQLLINNAKNMVNKPLDKENYFGAVYDNDSLILLFSRTKNYNLLIATNNSKVQDYCELLATYLYQNDYQLNGVNAPSEIGLPFIKKYTSLIKADYKVKIAMDIMVLTNLIPPKMAPGSIYLPTIDDLDVAMKFLKEFYIDIHMNQEFDYEEQKKKMIERIEDKKVYFYKNIANEIVAMCAKARQLINGVSISLVYCKKDQRGKGYASSLVYLVSKDCLDIGNKFTTLFVDKKNPISNRVYEKIGYRIIKDNIDYSIIK